MTGYSYDQFGRRFLPPKRRIASRDHKLFIGTRTVEIWRELCAQHGITHLHDDADELFDEALERSAKELTALARSKRVYMPRKAGRRALSFRSKVLREKFPTDDDLRRAYSIVRPTIRAPGKRYAAVARVLWVRDARIRDKVSSLQALRVRLMRAMKKVEQKGR